ncbi:hypothetical protein [Streptomyces sp. NBRC 110028]|uniref:hypothetical protein n=1 Tax=Streptomyces sp. NBRC 110028 TaxID=1621260 RepID=UPI0006E1D9A6|nr:hypothetical protein [Streptomyces sp. NBRC 110028]
MPSGNLVSHTTTISCPHGGRARPVSVPSSGVLLDGQPVPGAADAFAVIDCPHTVDGLPVPCTTVRWIPDRDGVLVDGAPVLLDTTAAQCFTAAMVPQGPPVVAATGQGRQGVVCQ